MTQLTFRGMGGPWVAISGMDTQSRARWRRLVCWLNDHRLVRRYDGTPRYFYGNAYVGRNARTCCCGKHVIYASEGTVRTF